jgi:hypothetical protein
MGHELRLLTSVLLGLSLATAADAITLNHDWLFTSADQSMWSEGGVAEWSEETFVGTRWGTYAGGSAVDRSLGVDVGAASVRGGLKSSGEIGIVPWATASGGGISIDLPAQTMITLPDRVRPNTYFSVSTFGLVSPEARISAAAPAFQTGIDGLFNMDNKLYGEAATFAGCGTFGLNSCEWYGDVDISLTPGRFPLFGFDSRAEDPFNIFGMDVSLVFDREYFIHVPAGPAYPFIYDADSGTTTPPITPVVGDITIHSLHDASGGTVDGDELSFSSYQGIFEAQLSITGVLEALIGSPGVLRQEITVFENSIKDIEAAYTLADVSTGPIFGMQQDFSLDPNLAVRLVFDQPVTRLEWTQVGSHVETQYVSKCFPLIGCISIPIGQIVVPDFEWVPVTYETGIIEMLLGENAALMFGHGFADLMRIEYFLNDPLFTNRTAATVDPALQIQLLCVRFTAVGQACVYDETFQTQGLASVDVYSSSWVMGGFDSFVVDMRGKGPIEDVPEPGTLTLLSLGLLGLAPARRAALTGLVSGAGGTHTAIKLTT